MKRRLKWISLLMMMSILTMMLFMQAGLASATSLALPAISPDGGAFTAAQSVTIGNIPDGDTAFYTTDGSDPTTSSSAVSYSGAFDVDQSETIEAAVYDAATGWSAVASAAFTIDNASAPTVQTGDATSLAADSATLNGDITDSGSDVITGYGFSYSTDEENWTDVNVGTDDHSGSFSYDLTGLTAGTTYYYKAYATNSVNTVYGDIISLETSNQSTPPAAPAISPDGGAFTVAQSVTIGNIPDGDTAFYTTDGSDPTTSSSAVSYSGAFNVDQSETIEAAVHDAATGWSAVASAAFTINNIPQTPTLIFTDISVTYWAYGDIDKLYSKGLIGGYPDNTFQPDRAITRAEFVNMLVKALDLQVVTSDVPTFTDASSGDWYFGAVETAVKNGLVKGYENNEFLPNAPINRQEMAAMLVQAMGKTADAATGASTATSFTDNAKIGDWARGFVASAFQDGLIQGYPDSSFQPMNSATRAEACAMIGNFLNIHK